MLNGPTCQALSGGDLGFRPADVVEAPLQRKAIERL